MNRIKPLLLPILGFWNILLRKIINNVFCTLLSGLLYDQERSFKPVFYLAAGPMGIGAFMLFLVPYFKPENVSSKAPSRKEMTTLEKSKESTTNTTHSSQLQSLQSAPNVILLSSCSNCREKKTELVVVDRLTSVWINGILWMLVEWSEIPRLHTTNTID